MGQQGATAAQPEADRPWDLALLVTTATSRLLSRTTLTTLAAHFYEEFRPYFEAQAEGSLRHGVNIEFSPRMRQKVGLAYLFEHRIRLNETYFAANPSLLPYTLFHELTHLWLYDCHLDPGHTRRFYEKMAEFSQTGFPIDDDIHVHRRVAPEGKYVYSCPNCHNRWYLREEPAKSIYCGHCYHREGVEFFAKPLPPGRRSSTDEPCRNAESDTAA